MSKPNKYDKPFRTYDEMISLLETRGIRIDDREFAKQTLSNTSYYALVNGNKVSYFGDSFEKEIPPGTSFDDLYHLFHLDDSLNHLLLKYVLYVERALKSRVSYIVSKDFGVYTNQDILFNRDKSDYLSPLNYPSNPKRNNTLIKIKQTITRPNVSESLEYYRNHHNHIPAWIVTTSISFGNTIFWYSILPPNDKAYVCSQFIPEAISAKDKKSLLYSSLMFLKDLRNHMAHGNKLGASSSINRGQQIILNKLSPEIFGQDDIQSDHNQLLLAISMIYTLIDDTNILERFRSEMSYIIQSYSGYDYFCHKDLLQLLHLPSDIIDRMEAYISRQQ